MTAWLPTVPTLFLKEMVEAVLAMQNTSCAWLTKMCFRGNLKIYYEIIPCFELSPIWVVGALPGGTDRGNKIIRCSKPHDAACLVFAVVVKWKQYILFLVILPPPPSHVYPKWNYLAHGAFLFTTREGERTACVCWTNWIILCLTNFLEKFTFMPGLEGRRQVEQ